MTTVFEFSPLEFVSIWDVFREEKLPEPLSYRGPASTYDDALQAKRRAWQDLRQRNDRELDALIGAMTQPDIRIVVWGIDCRAPSNPKRALRVLAVRKGETSFVIQQQPGETMSHSTGFTVTRHDAISMGDAVASLFPAAEAGRRRDFELIDTATTDLDFGYGRSLVHEDGDDSAAQAAAFLREPEDFAGTIDIEQGWSRFGPRGILRLHLAWRDLVDDGRYVIVPGSPAKAVPADRRRLVSLINSQIAEIVRAIRDDRA
ncbi:ESX secretion-associated protein EspG [Nocardia sp. NPDC058497]|uniref:ESX secretion-associated protein EspG n=1 Tax=Nocardia sp. NPDC058497 TaxID=3346529 RepID=UPI00365262B4